MSNNNNYLHILLVAAVLVGWGICLYAKHNKAPEIEQEKMYYISYGMVACATMEVTACGVRLTHCTDTLTYECLTNVRYEANGQ